MTRTRVDDLSVRDREELSRFALYCRAAGQAVAAGVPRDEAARAIYQDYYEGDEAPARLPATRRVPPGCCALPPDPEGYPCAMDEGHDGGCVPRRPPCETRGRRAPADPRTFEAAATHHPRYASAAAAADAYHKGCRCATCLVAYHSGRFLDDAPSSAGGW